MFTKSNFKWFISLILGGILLVLAMTGGGWKPTYAADANPNAVPIIAYIAPSALPAGSPDRIMVIAGSNFGTIPDYVRVWIKDAQTEYLAKPLGVIDTGISVVITDTLMVDPTLYSITVIKSNGQSIPSLPPWLPYDQISNSVDFLVYEGMPAYLPLIQK